MLSHEDDNVAPLLGEGPSHGRSTVVKPVLDETWTEVDELPEADDSEYSDEEVCLCMLIHFMFEPS